jgi:hypothetical protein
LERPPLRHELHGRHPEDEAADMGEERNSSTGLGLDDGEPALPQLEEEPDSKE